MTRYDDINSFFPTFIKYFFNMKLTPNCSSLCCTSKYTEQTTKTHVTENERVKLMFTLIAILRANG